MVWKNDQVSEKETEKILELARAEVRGKGDFVEFGCYKGDTSLLLSEVLRGTGRRLWIYDSFEGLPEKSEADESTLGEDFRGGELFITKRMVKERFLRANLPIPVIKKGWFRDLGEEDLPERISFAFLDGDFYESIRDSFRLVSSKMCDGGVIIIHDYRNLALPGVKRAVDEWLRENGDKYEAESYQSMIILRKRLV
ncbi:MAG: TylF/MycF/NovP-related O-methyltransferase [Candidatus Saccharibacteria bacterium]|nr:TylF/MycF/NovP-related O-methyltransferase [Candidatus Saccharibacteria bacterium]